MPVSRPILIALAGAVLALVALVGSSSLRGSEEASSPPPKPAKSAAPKTPTSSAKTGGASQSAGSTKPSTPESKAPSADRPNTAGAASGNVSARVERAYESGRTVVLFFYQRGGADDRATADAVAKLRGRRGVSVFISPVSRLGDFRAVTGSLGISQAPAVVIVGKNGQNGKARVVEGFVDPETLAQEVADSR